MTRSEARRQQQVALNALDLAHCLGAGRGAEITFDAWRDRFARGKELEAARKQWLRWRTDFERHGIPCLLVDDGRERHVILRPEAVEVAERLLAEAEAVLGAGTAPPRLEPWRRPAVAALEERGRAALEERDVRRRRLSRQELAELRRRRQERAAERRAAGRSLRQIAEEEGVTPATVHRDLEDSGELLVGAVVGRDGRRRRARGLTRDERTARRERIAALLAEEPHLTVRRIAARLGVSRGTVQRELAALTCRAALTALTGPTGSSAGRRLEVDPGLDDLTTCLEAALAGLERLRAETAGTALQPLADDVHELVRSVLWRLVESSSG